MDAVGKQQQDSPSSGDTASDVPLRADAGERRGEPDATTAKQPASTAEQPREKKSSKLPLIILGCIVVVGAVVGGIYWFLHRNEVSTDDAYTNGNAVLIAPEVKGYVIDLAVNDNQFVHRGDLLVAIDARPFVATRDEARGRLEAAQAQLTGAQVSLLKAQTTFPAQLAQAQGQLLQAQSQLTNAQTDYKRQHAVAREATTQQNIDQSTAALRSAEGQVQVAQAAVDVARLVPQNIAQAQAEVKQLEGQVAQAQAAVDQAEVDLSFTRVTAPQDGWVTKRNVNQGDYLQSGTQIMALVTTDLWVTANFKETELTRMRPGQRVDIEVDAYPGLKLTGKVDSIQLGTGSKFSAFPAENATGNFVKIVQRVPVKIKIVDGLDPGTPLPLGLSVVPTVFFQ